MDVITAVVKGAVPSLTGFGTQKAPPVHGEFHIVDPGLAGIIRREKLQLILRDRTILGLGGMGEFYLGVKQTEFGNEKGRTVHDITNTARNQKKRKRNRNKITKNTVK